MKKIKLSTSKFFWFLLCICLGTMALQAQKDIKVTGNVTSQEGDPIPGVNITVKGASQGTLTDFDGNYTITVSSESILVFSYIGYENREIVVNGRKIIDVSLTEEVLGLEKIVVVAYGTRKQSEIIGAVSTVEAETIENQQIATFEQALFGQVSGLQFRENGAPDGGPQLNIRGVSTFGNNNPLFVVDGFPLGTNAGDQQDNYILNSINPNDIESISVLKDAASKALYGSRASNGVIVITTKTGKKNTTPVISFSTNVGIQSIPDYEKPDVLNATELANYTLEVFEDQEAAGSPLGGLQLDARDEINAALAAGLGEGNNWFDLITRDALVRNYSIGVKGGSQRSRYATSIAHQDREGTVINTGFKRYSLNFNFDTDITDKLRLGLNFAPSRTTATGNGVNAISGNGRFYSAIPLAQWMDPSAPLRDDDGELTGSITGVSLFRSRNANPVSFMTEREAERRADLVRLGTFLEWEFLPGLKAKIFGSLQSIDRRNTSFVPAKLPGPNVRASPLGTTRASASVLESTAFNWVLENTLNYAKRFGNNQRHSLQLLAGFTAEKREATETFLQSNNLADPEIRIPSVGNTVDPSQFNARTDNQVFTLTSLIGRLDYSFDERYYLTATVRRDGTSRFGEGNRYGNFPAFGAAWRISNEAFFKPIRNVISDLKIEGGYGISGNNSNTGNYTFRGRVGVQSPNLDVNYLYGNTLAPGAAVTGLPNQNLGWEETRETNFGIDLGLFRNRITLSADYYDTRSVDFLFTQNLPRTSGLGGVGANLGEIQNKGYELELSARIIEKSDFSWSINLNYTSNRNEVIDIPQESGFFFPGGSDLTRVDGQVINMTEIREGQPIGLYRGFNVTGLFTQEEIDNPDIPKYPGAVEGSLKFEDIPTIDTDGDGIPDQADGELRANDLTIIGDPNPDFVFGFSTRINYKNIDLSITGDGAVGQDILLGQNQYLWDQTDGQFNIDPLLLNRWRPGDDPTTSTIPGTASGRSRQFFRAPNSLAVQAADYLWIRNITLGYRLEGNFFNDSFRNARVYISAQNPFLFTEYEYGNPTVNRNADNAAVRNVDNGAFPIARTVSLGLDITF
ncbi:TonB-dependent receptor [Aquimarina sp. U1-2]|uniref:SusC/RagA family TonB-linked outer membrane protein n=1 Tax=Aquimarina sp. U1-2 TaxID=2823141 RepID=UPI001AECB7E8|nr:TonB-dependent receptor [Aquimarina sp. U1-2]MBP2830655.1 TonB-dependent receptor [Aquimarina sp. U1-2]